MNLEKCIEIALKHNPAIAVSLHNIMAKEARFDQARTGYLPTLDASAGFQRTLTRDNAGCKIS